MVALPARSRLAPSPGPGKFGRAQEASPGRACHLRRRRSVCPMGRKVAADGGRVGVCGARWSRWCGYAGGNETLAGNRHLANTWQGEFPWQSFVQDGFEGTSPVGAFPPNGDGLVDVTGNVWEWTSDWYVPAHPADVPKACCIPRNPLGPPLEQSYDSSQPEIKIPRKVLRVARTSARRTIAGDIAPRRDFPSPSTRQPVTWGSAASTDPRQRRMEDRRSPVSYTAAAIFASCAVRRRGPCVCPRTWTRPRRSSWEAARLSASRRAPENLRYRCESSAAGCRDHSSLEILLPPHHPQEHRQAGLRRPAD